MNTENFGWLCEEVLDKAEEILDYYDNDAAIDFAQSVKTKAIGMQLYLDEYGTLTPKQQVALQRMSDGLTRWLDRTPDSNGYY